jgi:electron transfer flavoprotein beta subunit
MKIIVCLKEVIDPALSLDFGLAHRVVFREGLPLKLNPYDAFALSLALDINSPDKEITLISVGPERVESYLRNGLALGATKAVRIWSEELDVLSPYLKSLLLARAVSLLGADLVLTGGRSLDTGSGQIGPFLASRLGLPCVNEVVGLEPDAEQRNITLTKDIGRGEREKVRCPLPAVVAVKGEGTLPYASLDRLIDSKSREITLFSPADLAVSPAELKTEPAPVIALSFPRPAPRRVPPLDSSLPAFYRILQLLEGGVSQRKGRMLEGGPAELAEQLFDLLKEAGVLKPAAES